MTDEEKRDLHRIRKIAHRMAVLLNAVSDSPAWWKDLEGVLSDYRDYRDTCPEDPPEL